MNPPLFSKSEIQALLTDIDDTDLKAIQEKSLTPLFDEVLIDGEGVFIKDLQGNSYLDCTSQSWVMGLGFSNPDIYSAQVEQLRHLSHVTYGYLTPARIKLLNRLTSITHQSLGQEYRASFTNMGGGIAVEACLKMAMIAKPDANRFIVFHRAYHGSTLATTTLSQRQPGTIRYRPWGLDHVQTAPFPYCYRCPLLHDNPRTCHLACLNLLVQTIEYGSPDKIAGILIEPMQGPGGHIPAPKSYLEGLRRICDDNEIPLIFDEAQTAMGRLGYWFAAEYYNVNPDLIALTKALGGGIPMGATLALQDYPQFNYGEEHSTFGSSPLMFASSLIYLYTIERLNLLDHVQKMGIYLTEQLQTLQRRIPEIGDIRCPGLFIGVELIQDQETKEPANDLVDHVMENAKHQGVLFGKMPPVPSDQGGLYQNVLKIKPPLIITQEDCDRIIEVFTISLETALDSS